MQKFYEKLSELFSHWIPLEDVYYRNVEFGEIEFDKGKQDKRSEEKWPDLDSFNIAIAKNGGPIGK